MPFFGNILPTLRSYGGLEYGIDGKVTIGAQPSALGMNVPLALGQWLEVLGSSPVGHAFSAGRNDEISNKPFRAAQYVRMSTDHQKYSTENQAEALQRYATATGLYQAGPLLLLLVEMAGFHRIISRDVEEHLRGNQGRAIAVLRVALTGVFVRKSFAIIQGSFP